MTIDDLIGELERKGLIRNSSLTLQINDPNASLANGTYSLNIDTMVLDFVPDSSASERYSVQLYSGIFNLLLPLMSNSGRFISNTSLLDIAGITRQQLFNNMGALRTLLKKNIPGNVSAYLLRSEGEGKKLIYGFGVPEDSKLAEELSVVSKDRELRLTANYYEYRLEYRGKSYDLSKSEYRILDFVLHNLNSPICYEDVAASTGIDRNLIRKPFYVMRKKLPEEISDLLTVKNRRDNEALNLPAKEAAALRKACGDRLVNDRISVQVNDHNFMLANGVYVLDISTGMFHIYSGYRSLISELETSGIQSTHSFHLSNNEIKLLAPLMADAAKMLTRDAYSNLFDNPRQASYALVHIRNKLQQHLSHEVVSYLLKNTGTGCKRPLIGFAVPDDPVFVHRYYYDLPIGKVRLFSEEKEYYLTFNSVEYSLNFSEYKLIFYLLEHRGQQLLTGDIAVGADIKERMVSPLINNLRSKLPEELGSLITTIDAKKEPYVKYRIKTGDTRELTLEAELFDSFCSKEAPFADNFQLNRNTDIPLRVVVDNPDLPEKLHGTYCLIKMKRGKYGRKQHGALRYESPEGRVQIINLSPMQHDLLYLFMSDSAMSKYVSKENIRNFFDKRGKYKYLGEGTNKFYGFVTDQLLSLDDKLHGEGFDLRGIVTKVPYVRDGRDGYGFAVPYFREKICCKTDKGILVFDEAARELYLEKQDGKKHRHVALSASHLRSERLAETALLDLLMKADGRFVSRSMIAKWLDYDTSTMSWNCVPKVYESLENALVEKGMKRTLERVRIEERGKGGYMLVTQDELVPLAGYLRNAFGDVSADVLLWARDALSEKGVNIRAVRPYSNSIRTLFGVYLFPLSSGVSLTDGTGEATAFVAKIDSKENAAKESAVLRRLNWAEAQGYLPKNFAPVIIQDDPKYCDKYGVFFTRAVKSTPIMRSNTIYDIINGIAAFHIDNSIIFDNEWRKQNGFAETMPFSYHSFDEIGQNITMPKGAVLDKLAKFGNDEAIDRLVSLPDRFSRLRLAYETAIHILEKSGMYSENILVHKDLRFSNIILGSDGYTICDWASLARAPRIHDITRLLEDPDIAILDGVTGGLSLDAKKSYINYYGSLYANGNTNLDYLKEVHRLYWAAAVADNLRLAQAMLDTKACDPDKCDVYLKQAKNAWSQLKLFTRSGNYDINCTQATVSAGIYSYSFAN
ncbi:MAG: hypothetical protein V1859_10025 [archaeon]